MPHEAQRRELSFDDLDAVIRDVRHLSAIGYRQVGRWDLAQTCGHLSAWMRFPLDGYPPSNWLMGLGFAVLRVTWGRRTARKMFRQGVMRGGAPTLSQTVPPPGDADPPAVEQLCATIRRWQQHTGPLHPSPIFGAMDRVSATHLQLMHCALHLSHLIPTD